MTHTGSLRTGLAGLLLGLALAQGVHAADAQRVVQLAAATDAEAWAQKQGIEDFERRPLASGGTLLRFVMDDERWHAASATLCTDAGVLACGDDFCQSYFDAAPDGSRAESTPASALFLVPRPPDLGAFLEPEPEGNLPLRCPAGPDAGPTAVPANADGSPHLAARDADEFDRGCWEVIRVQACQVRTRPLSDLQPEYEPKRLLALLSAGAGGVDPALLQTVSGAAGVQLIDASPLPSIDRVLARFLVPAGTQTAAALLLLQAQPGVESAQFDYRYRVAAAHSDPYAWMNYGATLTGADRLQEVSSGEGVTVALIDTGVDVTHPELAARIAEAVDVTDFGMTPDRHGTAVAGLIAGEADNGVGAYGMAPRARVLAIKACQPESRTAVASRCWSSTLAKGLDLALARNARIINMSLGGPQDQVLQKVVAAALAKSALIVAAAGNGGADAAPPFPAATPGVLAVTAVDARVRLYGEDTLGSFVSLGAPGVNVPVPVPQETYPGQLSGSSMAAAHASGIAALLLSKAPMATGEQLRSALESSARPYASGSPTPGAGRGTIDACAAARALIGEACASPSGPAEAKP
jgi:hypothetical protein